MGILQQFFGSAIIASLASSCTLDSLVQSDSDSGSVSKKEISQSEVSYAKAFWRCIPPTMACSLIESSVSNEEYASATVVCTVPRRSCITTISYDAGDLETGSLTRYGKIFIGTIDTEAAVAGTYTLDLTGAGSRTSTSATLSLDIVDFYDPSLACTTSEGISDGSQDINILCISSDETSLDSVFYVSALGTDKLTNTRGDTYEASIDVTGITGGDKTVYIFAEDSSGNITPSEVTATVRDAINPTVTSVYTDVSSVLSDGTESFLVYACFSDDTDGTHLGGTVSATIDSVVETLSYDSGSGCFISSAINGNNFSAGTYSIAVTGADAAGNPVNDSSASIDVTELSSCPYTCASNICLYVDDNLEAEVTTSFPSQMTAIDTIRLGWSGQYFDAVSFVADSVTYVDEDFSSSIGCFTTGSVSSGIYITDSTDNDCAFSPAFDATSLDWVVSVEVIAGSQPNFALRSSSYPSPGVNWDFGSGSYINDGAGNSVYFTSGTPDSSVDHTVVMCNQNN